MGYKWRREQTKRLLDEFVLLVENMPRLKSASPDDAKSWVYQRRVLLDQYNKLITEDVASHEAMLAGHQPPVFVTHTTPDPDTET